MAPGGGGRYLCVADKQGNDSMTARNMTLEVALAEATERYVAANPASAARHEEACRSMPGGNTRTVLFYDPFPLTMAKGEGARLRDLDGHEYRDFLGEHTAGLYGHSNPRILDEVRAALTSGVVLGAPNRYEVELADLVCARFPSIDRVRFCNSGTEANLMAIGLARAVTGRAKVLVFEGAYHGGVLFFKEGESGPVNVPFDFVFAPYNDAEATRAAVERHAGELAAILVEPMMGSGGCIEGEREFLSALREAADRHGVLLIFDEVMTSRLGPGGRQGELGILPDLTTLGKYIGGGMTFGGFGGRADLLERFDPRRPDALPHAGTFNNNVLTMSAGVVGLRDIFTPDEAVRLNAKGDRLRERLQRAADERGVPFLATGCGSIIGLHWQGEPVRRPADTVVTPAAARSLSHLEMIRRGFFFARRGFISLSLPLEDADYDELVDAFADFLDEHRAVLSG